VDLQLEDQVVVLAGATGTLGAAVATQLVTDRARVVLLGRDASRLQEVRARLGERASTVVCDLADDDAAERALAEVVSAHGRIDAVVSAAGSTRRLPADELAATDFTEAMDAKLLPNVRLILAAARVMRGHGGRIVVVSGVGGSQPTGVHLPGGAANAALNLFAKGYARHLAADGIALNVVSPGAIAGPRLDGHHAARASAGNLTPEQAKAQLLADIPLGRAADVAEVASVVTFLASPRAAYVVATSVDVDGGLVAGL
jgi:NAD(P)-dependent dehydrogenase (short-subunit alcohol dehydrogenase family)